MTKISTAGSGNKIGSSGYRTQDLVVASARPLDDSKLNISKPWVSVWKYFRFEDFSPKVADSLLQGIDPELRWRHRRRKQFRSRHRRRRRRLERLSTTSTAATTTTTTTLTTSLSTGDGWSPVFSCLILFVSDWFVALTEYNLLTL